MNYSFYYSSKMEKEIHDWMTFLKQERGIKTFPDIPAGEVMTLAYYKGKEIRFKRIGLQVGQLIIDKYDGQGHLMESRPLYPYIRYGDGEPEENLVLDPETQKKFKDEQTEVRKIFHSEVREGIVRFK